MNQTQSVLWSTDSVIWNVGDHTLVGDLLFQCLYLHCIYSTVCGCCLLFVRRSILFPFRMQQEHPNGFVSGSDTLRIRMHVCRNAN